MMQNRVGSDAAPWQRSLVQQLEQFLQPHSDVLALLVYGSAAHHDSDLLSDLDVMVIVSDDAFPAWFPARTWLESLAPIFAQESHSGDNTGTARVCFVDGRRLDCVVATETCFRSRTTWGLWNGYQVAFARSQAVRDHLQRAFAPPAVVPISEDSFNQFIDAFWFRASMAMLKSLRADLVIGLHLTCELSQDVCLLVMFLRDRAAQTTIHRTGGAWNSMVQSLRLPASPLTCASLVASIDTLCQQFDALAMQWSSQYHPHYPTFQQQWQNTPGTVAV